MCSYTLGRDSVTRRLAIQDLPRLRNVFPLVTLPNISKAGPASRQDCTRSRSRRIDAFLGHGSECREAQCFLQFCRSIESVAGHLSQQRGPDREKQRGQQSKSKVQLGSWLNCYGGSRRRVSNCNVQESLLVHRFIDLRLVTLLRVQIVIPLVLRYLILQRVIVRSLFLQSAELSL